MPINKIYPLDDVMNALTEHIKITNRRVFIAYIMLHEINDSIAHAKGLVQLLKSQNVPLHLLHVDLIPYNTTAESNDFLLRSKNDRLAQFIMTLKKHGISVFKRVQFGKDIDAACGQLHGADE